MNSFEGGPGDGNIHLLVQQCGSKDLAHSLPRLVCGVAPAFSLHGLAFSRKPMCQKSSSSLLIFAAQSRTASDFVISVSKKALYVCHSHSLACTDDGCHIYSLLVKLVAEFFETRWIAIGIGPLI